MYEDMEILDWNKQIAVLGTKSWVFWYVCPLNIATGKRGIAIPIKRNAVTAFDTHADVAEA